MPYPYQTSVQKKSSIRFGSCKIEIGDTVPALDDIGIVKSVVFTEELTFSDRGADNADMIRFLRKVQAIVTGDQEELDLEMLFKLRGEIDSYSTVTGTEVPGAVQVVYAGGWGYNDFIQIEHQMGDKTSPTVNSVTGSTDGALVAETDYFVGQDDDGDWGIFIIDSVTVTTEAQNITINYDYRSCDSLSGRPTTTRTSTSPSSRTRVRIPRQTRSRSWESPTPARQQESRYTKSTTSSLSHNLLRGACR
jgi:hypothetical protein